VEIGSVSDRKTSKLILPRDESCRIGRIEISTNQVRSTERVDYWRQMVCQMFLEVDLTSHLGTSFCGEMICEPWSELSFSYVRANSHAVQRMGRWPQHDRQDCYFAVLLLSGTEYVEQSGRDVLLGPGDMVIYDAVERHRLVFGQNFDKLVIHIPRRLLNDRITGMERYTARRIGGDAGLGAVTADFLKTIVRESKLISQSQLADLSGQALDLIAMAISSLNTGGPRASMSRSLSLRRVKTYVEQHLGDPALDATGVSFAVGLSTRYTNKLFEDEGTSLVRFIWSRRLSNAHRDLLDPSHSGERISDIALRWGFSDFAHFSRAFRKRYGSAPRDYRLTHQPGIVVAQ
jgi:AraC family transcriptional regulator, positive regulator of tynA and feaB